MDMGDNSFNYGKPALLSSEHTRQNSRYLCKGMFPKDKGEKEKNLQPVKH